MEETDTRRVDGFPHAGHLVDVQVVEDDRVAALQHRVQRIGDVSQELAPWGSGIGAQHVGGSRHLVDEDEAVRIQIGLPVEPRLTRVPYVPTLLLVSVKSRFYG